jgi:hypothetical protein
MAYDKDTMREYQRARRQRIRAEKPTLDDILLRLSILEDKIKDKDEEDVR